MTAARGTQGRSGYKAKLFAQEGLCSGHGRVREPNVTTTIYADLRRFSREGGLGEPPDSAQGQGRAQGRLTRARGARRRQADAGSRRRKQERLSEARST